VNVPAYDPDGRDADQELYRKHLHREVNRALSIGALYATPVGAGLGVLVLGAWAVTDNLLYLGPGVFALFAGACALVVHLIAKRGLAAGPAKWGVMLSFVSLPTLFFLIAEAFYDSGAATFITGPYTYLYMFLTVITGFLFHPRLSAVAGVVAAAQYLAMYALARGELAGLQAPDPLMIEDMTAPFIYANKAAMFIATGFATGGIAHLARRLVLKTLEEQEDKARISRLFGEYVSDAVMEKLIAQSAGNMGERKEVTVLFSDLRGFSTFSEGKTPEEIVAKLNVYFEHMVQAIRKEGGVVDKFIGDAIMATFGGVLFVEEPAAAAARAAHEMRAALQRLNTSWGEDGVEPFDNGIGIHTGPVVQGPIGSKQRKEFTVIGDAVNTAARLEGLCKEKGAHIIVTDELYQQLPDEERARFRELGSTHVKGKAEQLTIWGAE
jgi:class 3 adenylate cyclase